MVRRTPIPSLSLPPQSDLLYVSARLPNTRPAMVNTPMKAGPASIWYSMPRPVYVHSQADTSIQLSTENTVGQLSTAAVNARSWRSGALENGYHHARWTASQTLKIPILTNIRGLCGPGVLWQVPTRRYLCMCASKMKVKACSKTTQRKQHLSATATPPEQADELQINIKGAFGSTGPQTQISWIPVSASRDM